MYFGMEGEGKIYIMNTFSVITLALIGIGGLFHFLTLLIPSRNHSPHYRLHHQDPFLENLDVSSDLPKEQFECSVQLF